MAWKPAFLTAEEVEVVCTGYMREVEAAAVREHLTRVATRVCGGGTMEAEDAAPLLEALIVERDRLKGQGG